MNVDDLLTNATCAILPTKHSETAEGTAWLATDDGHLLTAGHLFSELRAGSEVWVRFPDTVHSQLSRLVVDPEHDRPRALDFAILRLDDATTRIPLPFTLVSRAEGPIRARGYGTNLPRAQSGGNGTLLGGNYLRGGSSASFFFQYATTTLPVPGFSGSAIHSDVANAVIGLQVAQEGERTAFAMPLARIAEHWAELVRRAVKPTRGLCVLLLPSTVSEEYREVIRERVVRPVLESLNCALYVSELGKTQREDMRQLELADVVIADITYSDPQVVYELTVAQGLGTPDVVIMDDREQPSANELFDVLRLDVRDVARAQESLEKRLVSVRSIFEALGETANANPMTRFFQAPLTQISAANALALGYFVNFVRPLGYALLEAGKSQGRATVTLNGRKLPRRDIAGATLTVVLPGSLSWANDDHIDQTLAEPGHVITARVSHPDWSRDRVLKAFPLVLGQPLQLIDAYPTTLATMMEAIDERLDLSPSHRSLPAWRDLELKEMDRFKSKLIKRIRTDDRAIGHRKLADIVAVARATSVFPWLADGP